MDEARMLAESVDEPLRDRAYELALNVLWLESQLREIREADVEQTVEYDYCGKKGTKKNPIYDLFSTTFTQYRAGLSQLADMIEASGNAKPQAKSKLAELRVLTNDLKQAR